MPSALCTPGTPACPQENRQGASEAERACRGPVGAQREPVVAAPGVQAGDTGTSACVAGGEPTAHALEEDPLVSRVRNWKDSAPPGVGTAGLAAGWGVAEDSKGPFCTCGISAEVSK